MQITTILKILGAFLMLFSGSMLPPIGVALAYGDGGETAFLGAFIVTLMCGFFIWLPFRQQRKELKTRDGFLVVVLFWCVLSLFGAFPLFWAIKPDLNFTDAMFESVSGLTTTGSTILVGIDNLPHAIRFYRQELQFLGGMGIIVLAIAILPMLGVGGMQLYRAEMPGPLKDSKLTPRIAETAKTLWIIYISITAVCALAYWAAGMSLFEAISESFGTVATGGFSTHDASFAFYDSPVIELVAVFFMLIGSMNFFLHFYAMQRFSLRHYWKDEEFRTYLYMLLIATLITSTVLWWKGVYSLPTAMLKSLFNIVSLASTTGFTSAPFSTWPLFLPVLVILMGVLGGCASSSSGGMKVVRVLLFFKQGVREIRRLIHPKAVLTVKLDQHLIPEHVLQAIWGFIALFVGLFVILVLLLLATGLDLTSAFGAVAAGLTNSGAAIGTIATSMGSLSVFSKWVLIFAMVAGRLEIFTLLVLFFPSFWRH